MLACKTVIIMALICTGELFLASLVVFLKDVLSHVLSELECLSSVDSLWCLSAQRRSKRASFSLMASLIVIPRRPADLQPVYDLHAESGFSFGVLV